MKYFYLYVLICVFAISLSGCNNENALDCFKTTGEIIQQELDLNYFNSIEVLDEVDVFLIYSEEQKVVVKAGKNLIPKIKLEVTDELLTISNNNKCNWTRSPENPGIYIYSNDISNIAIFDFSNFISVDTVKLNDLHIYSDGTGNFDLILDVDSLSIESIYISNYEISGKANYLFLNFTDDSQFFGRNLISQQCAVFHEGSNRVEIYPVQSLTGTLRSTGSLYYYNNPGILDITVSGRGELVDLSN